MRATCRSRKTRSPSACPGEGRRWQPVRSAGRNCSRALAQRRSATSARTSARRTPHRRRATAARRQRPRPAAVAGPSRRLDSTASSISAPSRSGRRPLQRCSRTRRPRLSRPRKQRPARGRRATRRSRSNPWACRTKGVSPCRRCSCLRLRLRPRRTSRSAAGCRHQRLSGRWGKRAATLSKLPRSTRRAATTSRRHYWRSPTVICRRL
mmetsp:Transcript_38412/g.65913  ORF Transcript_38412/g.65913 Transcript_38412/m.65913 type:complete len:209 (+) Transcript_38412:452-1078(+)